ncbi:hypothetical protein BC826DRAFT_1028517 [Russula brevipes]|nr:hypothetical protein BC826DRAFT_1028517 [Russula brevipes]
MFVQKYTLYTPRTIGTQPTWSIFILSQVTTLIMPRFLLYRLQIFDSWILSCLPSAAYTVCCLYSHKALLCKVLAAFN